ncbi:hypothetical protein C8J57DRAFT_1625047, partial [Mycena rebaudengoi]
MTSEQANVMAREARMRRQILVDKAADATSDCLNGLSELELKQKANLVLTIMTEKRDGASFSGARKLVNGGVVFDCQDDVMATWVKQTEVMREFVAALGGTCVYKPRRIEMVAEMVPVEATLEDAEMWRLVESDSGIAPGGINGGRWIKAPQRRTSTQRVAHAKVDFATAEAANHAIDHGIFILGRRVRVRKSEEEARRCAKCQKFAGHIAINCTEEADVCGRCAASHRTANCTLTDRESFH